MARCVRAHWWWLLVVAALWLPLKLLRGWNAEPWFMLLSSWAADSSLLLWLGLGTGLVLERSRLGWLLLPLELAVVGVVSAHSYYLQEAAARQFSLLDASWGAAVFFLREVVPSEVLYGALALLVGSWLLAWWLGRLPPPRPKVQAVATGAVSLAAAVHLAASSFYSSVWWEMGRDLVEALSHPSATGRQGEELLLGAERGAAANWGESSFRKIVVLVMESVPDRELEERRPDLAKDNFFSRRHAQAHIYEKYFTTNQDSRTGLLAMLFGRLIPFEAYSERDARRYLFLREQPSLLARLKVGGFSTVVAAAQTDAELVVFELPWERKLILSQEEFENPGPYLCFHPYAFEHDCEDKILLPKIVSELRAREKIFLLQEGVFGHIGDYYRATGKSSVQYYGEHLENLVEALEESGDWQDTLLVVTSDHGIRDWDYRRRLWAYRLPLWFVSPRFSARRVGGFYNQSDFPALLAAELSGKDPPPARQLSPFVGCTNSALVGAIGPEGDFLLVKERRWKSYLLASGNCSREDEPDGPLRTNLEGEALLDFFRHAREEFVPGHLSPP